MKINAPSFLWDELTEAEQAYQNRRVVAIARAKATAKKETVWPTVAACFYFGIAAGIFASILTF
jgi:hypothetical protein